MKKTAVLRDTTKGTSCTAQSVFFWNLFHQAIGKDTAIAH